MVEHLLIPLASLVYQQRRLGRALHYHWQGRARRDPVRGQRTLQGYRCGRVRLARRRCYIDLEVLWLPVRRTSLGLTYVKYLGQGGEAMESVEATGGLTQDQIM